MMWHTTKHPMNTKVIGDTKARDTVMKASVTMADSALEDTTADSVANTADSVANTAESADLDITEDWEVLAEVSAEVSADSEVMVDMKSTVTGSPLFQRAKRRRDQPARNAIPKRRRLQRSIGLSTFGHR